MDNSNFGQSGQSNVWPPPPAPESGVWPPPPTGLPQGITFPFKNLLLRVEGSVSDFRIGTMTFSENGVFVQGKAVLRAQIQIPILLVCILLRLGFLIAYLIMEYAFRRDEVLTVAWAQVRQVVLVPKKQRVCLVYDAPNYKGVVKVFSLAFKPDPGQYEAFAATAQQFVLDRVHEGKLRTWRSPAIWIFLGALLLGLIVLAVLATTGAFNTTS